MITVMVSRLWLMSLQACVLILIVLAVRAMLKNYPKIYSYSLWILVGIRLLCPVFVESPFSLQPDWTEISQAVQGETDSIGLPEIDMLQGVDANDEPQGLAGAENALGADGNGTSPKQGVGKLLKGNTIPEMLLQVLTVIYLAGAAGFTGFYLVQYFIMRRRMSTAVRGKGNVWFCERIQSPFVMGIFRPRIYLPYGMSPQEKYHVLKHERTHIQHHDPFILMIGILCICLHWWNPFVWLAVRNMNQDMEMFCDEAVLNHSTVEERKSYAMVLLSFAERQNGFPLELAFGESHTERRVKNLMRRRKKSAVVVCIVALLAVFCVIALLTVPGNETGENTRPDTGTPQQDAGSEPEIEQEPDLEPNLEQEPEQEPEPAASQPDDTVNEASYFGSWYVWDYQAAEVSGLSTEDCKMFLNAVVTYQADGVYMNDQKIEIAALDYEETVYTEDLLMQDYRANLGEWWSNKEQVTRVLVSTSDSFFGNQFFAADEDSIWICYEGVFFLARRTWKEV